MQKLDLTDQRFGSLTVLRPVENIGGRTAWICRCDCGRESVVRLADLRGGHTKTCGCQRSTTINLLRSRLTYVDGTCVEKIQTKTVQKNNTSGVTGVEWLPHRQKWKASISFKKKRYHLGCFSKFEDAVKARKKAEEDLFDTFLDVHSGKISESELRDIEEVRPTKGSPD